MTVEAYWGLSDDELYEIIGEAVLGGGLGAGPEDRRRFRVFGRGLFEEMHRDLQRKICHHERLRGLIDADGGTRADVTDAAGIAKVLEELGGGTGHPVLDYAAVGVLVSRIGLRAFCANAPAPELEPEPTEGPEPPQRGGE
ncbi:MULTISPECIES: hypothetical protein [Kitasatospora]|uniref:Uncharacterized protein n=1 Tax=Kitasatospora setae (strain ATCC 33774 / DSM 43861 / JCM 3304 / KCC A-0304 / NBRC 14216 / KM-6054) TaxID=452652 RepID=E4NJN4_KITSK|nr:MULTISPECIES: hypothetical protein [Kitasatospora]BAJ33182.1 hypothetical protein KSE_74270 [Kitasatospora setae KM-6054]